MTFTITVKETTNENQLLVRATVNTGERDIKLSWHIVTERNPNTLDMTAMLLTHLADALTARAKSITVAH